MEGYLTVTERRSFSTTYLQLDEHGNHGDFALCGRTGKATRGLWLTKPTVTDVLDSDIIGHSSHHHIHSVGGPEPE